METQEKTIAIKERLQLIRYDASSLKRSYGVLRYYDLYLGNKKMATFSGKHALANARMEMKALLTCDKHVMATFKRAKERLGL
jgi:hypothetical protein